jgi:hypothetical protein
MDSEQFSAFWDGFEGTLKSLIEMAKAQSK